MWLTDFLEEFRESRQIERKIQKELNTVSDNYHARVIAAVEEAKEFNRTRKPHLVNYIPAKKYLEKLFDVEYGGAELF